MDFKTTYNKKTDKTTYYVDNKRVSGEIFALKQTICRLSGKNFNSSLVTSDNNYVRGYFSYN